jgi:hypothetical protein
MTEQLPLRPCARNADPVTSALSDRAHRRSGRLARELRETLEALVAWRGDEPPTCGELAGGDGALIHRFGRRLSDLRDLGWVENTEAKRRCRYTGRVVMLWRVTPEGRRVAGEVR